MPKFVKPIFLTLMLAITPAAYAEKSAADAPMTIFADQYETQKMLAREPDAIAASHGRAVRNGDSLILSLADGRSQSLVDNRTGCGKPDTDYRNCLHFAFVADMPRKHAFLVGEYYYEGGRIDLIDDRTGTRTQFAAIPRFSPTDDMLLIISNDETGDAGLVQLWRRADDRIEKVWQIADKDRGDQTEFIGWDSSRIRLDIWNPASGKTPESHRQAILARNDTGWTLIFNGRQ